MAKEEPDERAEPIVDAERLCCQQSSEISLRSFKSRLAEWREQCLRFQASGETWLPTKPCCPASPFLGLEACLWQGCKKHEPTPCAQLLSIEELLELYESFRENPHHGLFKDQPGAASGSEPRLDVRPWMQDLPARVWAGSDYLLEQNGMLKLSPTPCGSAAQCHEGSITEPSEKHSESVAEPRLGGQAPKRQLAGSWHVQPRNTATKKRGRGGTGKVKERAEALKLRRKQVTARAKAHKLAKNSERKTAPVSDVKGVYFCKDKIWRKRAPLSDVRGVYFCKDKIWRVYMYNPSTQKQFFGGSFSVQREAEAKARKLGKELGVRTKRKAHFEPLGTQKGIKWYRGGWRAWFKISESKKQIETTCIPDDLSTKEVEKAWKKAVAWRKQQEKQHLQQAGKR